MGKDTIHLRLFSFRFSIMGVFGLVWSFLWQSTPEFRQSSISNMTITEIDSSLSFIRNFGALFLSLTAIITICGFTLHSIGQHFIFIVAHSIGILLTIISILNYWNVKDLWIPAIFSCFFPFLIEFIGLILICMGKSQHY